ncbi:MAG: replication factor C large subunit [Candidatus Thermoplasmatota archaeon]|nr:replication factor C large subunit [Candidatus Thermoplasmatota archaeon]
MLDWTEQYRPKNLAGIVGNKKIVRSLSQWAESWVTNKPSKKAVILSGSPGIGKTSCAYALAHQFKWTPIELNTSDARNAARIKSVATAGATHQTFKDDGSFSSTKQGGRKLIILDEADNLYESSKGSQSDGNDLSDRGGKKTIVDTIRITSQPIILIVNDYYSLIKGSGEVLRSLCLHLKFYPPYPNEIYQLLQSILAKEHIHVDHAVLEALSQGCHGDIRAAVRDLQSLCVNRTHITMMDYQALGNRDHQRIIFDVLKDIFRTNDISTIRSSMLHADEDPNLILHWIAENLPRTYVNPADTLAAYEKISLADRYLGRTNKRNYYGLWAYASDLMSSGVALSKTDQIASITYGFPTWLKYSKKQRTEYAHEQSLIIKLSSYFHCSTKKTVEFYIPIVKKIISQEPVVALHLIKELRLTDEEISYFGGSIIDLKKERNAKERQVEKETDENKDTVQIENEDQGSIKEERKQQSLLLDF